MPEVHVEHIFKVKLFQQGAECVTTITVASKGFACSLVT